MNASGTQSVIALQTILEGDGELLLASVRSRASCNLELSNGSRYSFLYSWNSTSGCVVPHKAEKL